MFVDAVDGNEGPKEMKKKMAGPDGCDDHPTKLFLLFKFSEEQLR